MTWTTARPTQAGWYWWRNGTGFELMEVWALSDELRCNFVRSHHHWDVNEIEGEWQGPIEPHD